MTSPLRLACVVAAVTFVAASGCAARTGPDVVLVHGALGDYRQWEPISTALPRSYRVIAVSRRFHWPNPPPAGDVPYTFDAQSADLDALLQSLTRPAHVV